MNDKDLFSGCIMLRLSNVDFQQLVFDVCKSYRCIIIEPEFDCHVTIGYGFHRDDIKRLVKGDIKIPKSLLYVETNQDSTLFNNDRTILKLDVLQSSIINLGTIRKQCSLKCRCIETNPVYKPHVTIGYFIKNSNISVNLRNTRFMPTQLLVSYLDEKSNRQQCVI